MAYIGQPPANKVIKTADIEDSAVTAAKIAADTIAAGDLAANSVDSSELVDGSIDTSHIGASQVTTAKIAADNIVASLIADDAIDSEHYTDGSIDTAHINDLNVTTAKIAADAITVAKIADDAIDSEHYTDGSIDNAHIADDQIDSEHYAAGSIDLEHMSSESVDEDNLHISNAGTNGQALTKQSGNAGGLTWADAGGAADDYFASGLGTKDLGDGLHVKLADSGVTSLNIQGNDLVVEDSSTTGISLLGGTSGACNIFFADSGSTEAGRIQYDHGGNDMYIKTNATTALKMESDQECRFTANAQAAVTDGSWSFSGLRSGWTFKIRNHYASGTPSLLSLDTPSHSGPISYWINMADSGASRCHILGDGDIKNVDNSYGAISDERIKQDITDAHSQWDDIKGLRVRNFKRKDEVRDKGESAKTHIGLIAQETELVSPHLVDENPADKFDIRLDSVFGTLWTADDPETQDEVLFTADDQEVIEGNKNIGDIRTPATAEIGEVKTQGVDIKSMKYSVLYMKAIKCLQEAQTRIETLEAKVTALENT